MRKGYLSGTEIAALIILTAVLAVACAPPGTASPDVVAPTLTPTRAPVDPTVQPPTASGGVKIVTSDIERVSDPDVIPSVLEAVAEGHNDFAFGLYQAIRGEGSNLFYSPYSISTALAMTYAGARGETAAQMAEVLGFAEDQDALHPAMNAIAQRLMAQDSLTLTVANSLWAQEDYAFLESYLDALARNYGAGLYLVDYIDPMAREAARQAINAWVEAETQGKIEELLKQGMLTDLTRLVLANAIYFKGDWETPFRHGTNDAPFILLDGSKVTVPMMARRAATPYAGKNDYQAVALPYVGERMQMVVIVPTEGAFAKVEAMLDAEFASSVVSQLETTDVKLHLPRFSYDARLDLEQTLAAMGMPDAFDAERADFSGMDGTTHLHLSRVAHKAFVTVDEEGTEAAAATGIIVEVESMPLEVRADRPFIYFIHDTELDLILFMGRVVNPTAD